MAERPVDGIHATKRNAFLRPAYFTICLLSGALLLGRVDSLHAHERSKPACESESNDADSHADLKRRVEKLETEVAELKRLLEEHAEVENVARADRDASSAVRRSDVISPQTGTSQGSARSSAFAPADRKMLDFYRDTTINVTLDETTAAFDYGFLTRYEWRRDFSNEPSFLTSS